MQLAYARHLVRSMTWHLHKAGAWRIPDDLKSPISDNLGFVCSLIPFLTPHVHGGLLGQVPVKAEQLRRCKLEVLRGYLE